MQTKHYAHKRKGGSYRIRCIAKGSGTLNATGNDELVVYHNELGQHFVRPLEEFLEVMSEFNKKRVIKPNWPKSAELRSAQIMQNGNDAAPYLNRKEVQ